MKIAFYSHEIDYAGTWRSHERIAEVIQHVKDFEVCVLYSPLVKNNRLQESRRVLHSCEFIPFERSLEKSGPQTGYAPVSTDIAEVVKKNKIVNGQLQHAMRQKKQE